MDDLIPDNVPHETIPQFSVSFRLTYKESYRTELNYQMVQGLRRRNWQTVIFGVLAVMYLISFLMNTSSIMLFGLFLICGAFVALVWFFPRLLARQKAQFVSERQDLVDFSVYDDRVEVVSDYFSYSLKKGDVEVREDDELFYLYGGDEKNFYIPKLRLKETEQDILRTFKDE